MLWTFSHRLIITVTLLAFLGGMTLQLMPPQAALAASALPSTGNCSQMTMPADDTGAGHQAPGKASDLPECIKQMGCLGTPSLPLRLGTEIVPFAYDKVAYWTPAGLRDGRSIEPDLFPPIGL